MWHFMPTRGIVGDSPERILRATTRKYSRIVLRHERISHSDEFTKTVYVEFEETNEIIKLSEQLRRSYSHSFGYEFQPHLSLTYASLKAVQREGAIAPCAPPFSEIAFDRVAAIVAPDKTKSRADWKHGRVQAASIRSAARTRRGDCRPGKTERYPRRACHQPATLHFCLTSIANLSATAINATPPQS
jgi:hypothetical protein